MTRNRPRPTVQERTGSADAAARMLLRQLHEGIQDAKVARSALEEERIAAMELVNKLQNTLLGECRRIEEILREALRKNLGDIEPAIRAAIEAASGALQERFEDVETRMLDELTAMESTVRMWASGQFQGPDSVRSEPLICPHCASTNNGHTSYRNGRAQPEPGMRSLCTRCGFVSIFDAGPAGDLVLRLPDAAEHEENKSNAQLLFAQRIIQASSTRAAR